MVGNPTVHDDAYAGSANMNAGNLFNSPDGMMIDTTGLIWIQTDGNDSNEGDFEGMGNNQMLAGDPATGEIVRFLTGPKGCEVTGLTWSSDRRTMLWASSIRVTMAADHTARLRGRPSSRAMAAWWADTARAMIGGAVPLRRPFRILSTWGLDVRPCRL
jgi:sugar lactone lactonase YvrE